MIALYDCDEWVEPNPLRTVSWRPPRLPRWEKLAAKFGRRYFVVECRIEPPEGDSLAEFAISLSGPLSVPVGSVPTPGDTAIYLYGTHWSVSEYASLDSFERLLARKIGHLDVGSVAIRITPTAEWPPKED